MACFEAVFFLFEELESQFIFPQEHQQIERFEKAWHLMEGRLHQALSTGKDGGSASSSVGSLELRKQDQPDHPLDPGHPSAQSSF